MACWLVKSEPSVYSISDLKRDQTTEWTGVRNYQARNFLRAMKRGDRVLFYHSNADVTGIAGVARVVEAAQPDPTQFDKNSEYFDPKATEAEPRWFAAKVGFVKEFSRVIQLAELKTNSDLRAMELLRKGSRLSVQTVTPSEYETILRLANE